MEQVTPEYVATVLGTGIIILAAVWFVVAIVWERIKRASRRRRR
jgi:hypothetical protein